MVTKDMLIGQILQVSDKAPQVLMGIGMHCLGCPSSQMESLEDACKVHGVNVDEVVAMLNA